MIQITQCPKCQASFRVTENELNIAQGLVVCNECQFIFQAMEHMKEVRNPLKKFTHDPIQVVAKPTEKFQHPIKNHSDHAQVQQASQQVQQKPAQATAKQQSPQQPKPAKPTQQVSQKTAQPTANNPSQQPKPQQAKPAQQAPQKKAQPVAKQPTRQATQQGQHNKAPTNTTPTPEKKNTTTETQKPKNIANTIVKNAPKPPIKLPNWQKIKAFFTTKKSTNPKLTDKKETDPLSIVIPLGKRFIPTGTTKTENKPSHVEKKVEKKVEKPVRTQPSTPHTSHTRRYDDRGLYQNSEEWKRIEPMVFAKLRQIKPDTSDEELRSLLRSILNSPSMKERQAEQAQRAKELEAEAFQPVVNTPSVPATSMLPDDMTLIPVAGLNGRDEVVYMPVKKSDLPHHAMPYFPQHMAHKDENNWTVATIVALIILIIQMFYLILQK